MANNKENNILVLDDGTREIKLENQYGDAICTLRIRTSDLGIVDRYKEVTRNLEKSIGELANFDLKPDGTLDDASQFMQEWGVLKQVEAEVINQFNVLLDTHNAEEIFKTRNAFSSIGGDFFFEKVLNALGKFIQQNMEKEAELAKKRTEKYTKDIENEKRG